jgi:DNA-binding NarL/FixJ family response regulator
MNLTPQQEGVALLIAAGMSNKEISRAMGIAVGTVKAHLREARIRVGARNRTALAVQVALHAVEK